MGCYNTIVTMVAKWSGTYELFILWYTKKLVFLYYSSINVQTCVKIDGNKRNFTQKKQLTTLLFTTRHYVWIMVKKCCLLENGFSPTIDHKSIIQYITCPSHFSHSFSHSLASKLSSSPPPQFHSLIFFMLNYFFKNKFLLQYMFYW